MVDKIKNVFFMMSLKFILSKNNLIYLIDQNSKVKNFLSVL